MSGRKCSASRSRLWIRGAQGLLLGELERRHHRLGAELDLSTVLRILGPGIVLGLDQLGDTELGAMLSQAGKRASPDPRFVASVHCTGLSLSGVVSVGFSWHRSEKQ